MALNYNGDLQPVPIFSPNLSRIILNNDIKHGKLEQKFEFADLQNIPMISAFKVPQTTRP